MSKKSETKFDFSAGGIFKGIGNFLELINQMTGEGKEEFSKTGEIPGLAGKAKGVYGFSVKLGIGGKPVVEQFGNIKETEKGVMVEEVREPLTDIIEEEDRIQVLMELPGIEEDKIKIEVKGDILNLETQDNHRKYAKEILLPAQVKTEPLKTSFKNGILEIILAKS